MTKRLAASAAVAACVLLLASCPLDLRSYVEWLKARDTIIPIEEILIASAGDSFGMGAPPAIEALQRFTYSFWMSKYEITNAQFRKFLEDGGYTNADYWTTNGWAWLTGVYPTPTDRMPYCWTNISFNADQQPVVGITWYEAVAYCNWRSVKEGLTRLDALPYGRTGLLDRAINGYRLPTEAEWEYAAAKGAPGNSERIYAYGDSPDPARETCADSVPSPSSPSGVGSRSAAGGDSREGLCDMNGNVWEWCSDNFIASTPSIDRYFWLGDATGDRMVARGGSWAQTVSLTTCADALGLSPGTMTDATVGFRTVRQQ